MKFFFSFLYVTTIIVSNIIASWLIPLPFGGIISAANFTFGITFTLRDALHRMYQRRLYIYILIVIAVISSFVTLFFLQEPIRIAFASAIGLFLSEAFDTELFHRMKRHWIIRVITSNTFSIPFDGIIFFVISFAGVFPVDVLLSLIITTTIVKYIISLISIVIVYPIFTTFRGGLYDNV